MLLHNQRIKGQSGLRHQIDVYWEFVDRDGMLSRVAIECKHYSNRVKIGNVRDFFGVLKDIGDIKGVLITKVGFESGAVKFAEHYDIQLKEIRFPEEKDWRGRLKDLPLKIVAPKPIVLRRRIAPDTRWLIQEQKVSPGSRFFSCSLPLKFEDEINVYDERGRKLIDFLEMKRDLPYQFLEQQGLQHAYCFTNGFIDTNEFGRIKILSVEFTYDVVAAVVEAATEGDEIAKAIIRDVKTGGIELVDKYGSIRT